MHILDHAIIIFYISFFSVLTTFINDSLVAEENMVE